MRKGGSSVPAPRSAAARAREGWFRVKPPIRGTIDFRRLNLMEAFRPAQPFHAIFCRNVMIYFNKETQGQLVNRFASCLAPGDIC